MKDISEARIAPEFEKDKAKIIKFLFNACDFFSSPFYQMHLSKITRSNFFTEFQAKSLLRGANAFDPAYMKFPIEYVIRYWLFITKAEVALDPKGNLIADNNKETIRSLKDFYLRTGQLTKKQLGLFEFLTKDRLPVKSRIMNKIENHKTAYLDLVINQLSEEMKKKIKNSKNLSELKKQISLRRKDSIKTSLLELLYKLLTNTETKIKENPTILKKTTNLTQNPKTENIHEIEEEELTTTSFMSLKKMRESLTFSA